MARIGVLALQGGYAAHARHLGALGHEAVEVRLPAELDRLDGLILPGGESTAQLKLMASSGLEGALGAFVASGKPVLATCAGLILAARRVYGPEQVSYGWLDVEVRRNAYGRQLDSFEAVTDGGLRALFIRAPRITEVGAGVEVVDRLRGEPVVVRRAAFWGATCHPELTDSTALHRRVFSI